MSVYQGMWTVRRFRWWERPFRRLIVRWHTRHGRTALLFGRPITPSELIRLLGPIEGDR